MKVLEYGRFSSSSLFTFEHTAMQTTPSDDLPLIEDSMDSKFSKRNELILKKTFSRSYKIGQWIWKHKLMLLCLTLLSLNILLLLTLRREYKQDKVRLYASNDVKISLDDYLLIKNLCYGIFCSKHLCYCSSKENTDWFSANEKCKENFKNSSLATGKINDIQKALSEEFLIHKQNNMQRSDSMWIGAYANKYGRSLWINNKSFEHKIIPVDNCVMKVNDHFERASCIALFQKTRDMICKYAQNLSQNLSIRCFKEHCRGKFCYCRERAFNYFVPNNCHFGLSSLVFFNSKDEMDYVLENFGGSYYIGANDLDEAGKWSWFDGKSGINFGNVENFIDRDVAKGCCIYSESKNSFIEYMDIETYLPYLCAFPKFSSKKAEIPLSFLYREMGAPQCEHISCNRDFHTCYCFASKYENILCDSYANWNLLTLKNGTEMKYVQSLMKNNSTKWRVGANNFIERQKFQWIEAGGLNVSFHSNNQDYKCLTLSKIAIEASSCQESLHYICSTKTKQLIDHANYFRAHL